MDKFLGYCTETNDNAVVLTEEEYRKSGISEDWCEYVWIYADSKSEAYVRYDEAILEYEEDNKACRPIKEAY